MKVETISKAIIAALLAAEHCKLHEAALMQNRITDLETQRDIYKSMYEDWKRRGRRSCRVCRYLAGFSESTGPTGWKIAG